MKEKTQQDETKCECKASRRRGLRCCCSFLSRLCIGGIHVSSAFVRLFTDPLGMRDAVDLPAKVSAAVTEAQRLVGSVTPAGHTLTGEGAGMSSPASHISNLIRLDLLSSIVQLPSCIVHRYHRNIHRKADMRMDHRESSGFLDHGGWCRGNDGLLSPCVILAS